MKKLATILIALTMAACAGRAPDPVAAVLPGDASMRCSDLRAEVAVNNVRVKQLATEKNYKLAQNVAAGVTAVFFLPAALLMDLQGTQRVETDALNLRQQRLIELMAERHC